MSRQNHFHTCLMRYYKYKVVLDIGVLNYDQKHKESTSCRHQMLDQKNNKRHFRIEITT